MEIKNEGNSGRIIPGEKIDLTNSEKLKKEGMKLVEKDINNIILDFKNVKEITSSAIGKILYLSKVTKENNIGLIVKNPNSEYVKKVFDMLSLEEELEIIY